MREKVHAAWARATQLGETQSAQVLLLIIQEFWSPFWETETMNNDYLDPEGSIISTSAHGRHEARATGRGCKVAVSVKLCGEHPVGVWDVFIICWRSATLKLEASISKAGLLSRFQFELLH